MAGGNETTGAERDLIARLDQAFAHQRDLDPAVLASVRAWQQTDRTYEMVQRIARGWGASGRSSIDIDRAGTIRAHLDIAIANGRMPFEGVVYRGLRDLGSILHGSAPGDAVGRRIPQRGYLAATAIKSVAVGEFVGRRGALLEIVVPVGTPALWVAGVGHPLLRRQAELLLRDEIDLHVYSLSWFGSIPMLSTKVVSE
jgi:hypothetical protein